MIGLVKYNQKSSKIKDFSSTNLDWSQPIESFSVESLIAKIKSDNCIQIKNNIFLIFSSNPVLKKFEDFRGDIFDNLSPNLDLALKQLVIRFELYLHYKEKKIISFSPNILVDLFLRWLAKFEHSRMALDFGKLNLDKKIEDVFTKTLLLVDQGEMSEINLKYFLDFVDLQGSNLQGFYHELIIWFNLNKLFFPELHEQYLDNFKLEKENFIYIKIAMQDILYWQDWKIARKYIDSLLPLYSFEGEHWYEFSKFCFMMGELTYSLFKGQNTDLIVYFFEKTLNFISRSEDNEEIYKLFSATSWYIGQIEYERGYSIKSSEYQLSAFQGMSRDSFEKLIPIHREKIRKKLLLSLFQGSTDLFIAGKVSAQVLQYDISKTYMNQSLKYVLQVLRILLDEPSNLVKVKELIFQLHTVSRRENYFQDDFCDLHSLDAINKLDITYLVHFVDEHIKMMDLEHDQLLWLSIIDKGGITLFSYDFTGKGDSKRNSLYSSFIFAVSKWGEKELASGPATELTFSGNTIIIESKELVDIIVVATKSSIDIRNGVNSFANAFLQTHEHHLQNWSGSTKLFNNTYELIERFFVKFIK